MSVNFRPFIILCFSVVGKGQILLDAQCHIGVTAGTQVKVTLTRHESAAAGAGTGDSHVILILILSRPKFGEGSRSNMAAESTSNVRGSKNFLNQNPVTFVTINAYI